MLITVSRTDSSLPLRRASRSLRSCNTPNGLPAATGAKHSLPMLKTEHYTCTHTHTNTGTYTCRHQYQLYHVAVISCRWPHHCLFSVCLWVCLFCFFYIFVWIKHFITQERDIPTERSHLLLTHLNKAKKSFRATVSLLQK